jgi:hypothetical protein
MYSNITSFFRFANKRLKRGIKFTNIRQSMLKL